DVGGPRHAVARAPHGGDEIVDEHRGHDRLRLLRRDHADVHAEPVLQRDPRLVAAQVLLVGDEREIPDLAVADVDPELLLEALEDLDALERDPDLGLGGKLRADPAGGLARRPRPDRLALEHDDVALPALRQLVGDAAPHHPATDHDDLRRARQAHAGRGPMLEASASCAMRTSDVMSNTGRPVSRRMSSAYGGMFVHSSTIAPTSGCSETSRRATRTCSSRAASTSSSSSSSSITRVNSFSVSIPTTASGMSGPIPAPARCSGVTEGALTVMIPTRRPG